MLITKIYAIGNFLLVIFSSSILFAQQKKVINSDTLIISPSFILKNIKNKEFDSQKIKNKVIVINFWYLGCIPCLREIKNLNLLEKKYHHNRNVIFLAIAVQGKPEQLKKFLKRRPFNYEIVISDFSLAKKFGVKYYPTNIIINQNKEIVYSNYGYQESIESILSESIDKFIKNK